MTSEKNENETKINSMLGFNPNGKDGGDPGIFDEALGEVEHVYKTYLDLAEYKVRGLLRKQFERDLFFQIGLGMALLGLLSLCAAGVYFLEPYIQPGFVLLMMAAIFAFASYLLVNKAFFSNPKPSSAREQVKDPDKERIEDNVSLATKRLAIALNHTEDKALSRINPLNYVSDKVRENPGKSLGVAMALGLTTLLSRESRDE